MVELNDDAHRGNHRRLSASILPAGSVDADAVAEMFELYSQYYDGTSHELFEHDLRDKDRVLILKTEAGTLAGFSTLALLDLELPGGTTRAIFSGDTIIGREYWGTQILAFTWIRLAGQIKAEAPERPLFWFLIVKGHRTYRYLSAFSIDFFPRWNAPTPPWAKSVMDGLARHRFGDSYDARRGIVSFPQSRGHLNSEWAAVEPDERSREDVAFFLAKNPCYADGDELVCLTELSLQNLQPLARRIFQRGLAE
jgi:hypothetical protein